MSARKRRRSERAEVRSAQDFRVELLQLEIASGYDGLLRGTPEPVLVVGAYALGASPRTLLRTVCRIDVLEHLFPQTIPASDGEQRARLGPVVGPDVGPDSGEARVLLLVVGVEDDGGPGVSKVYGALERAPELAIASLERGDDTKTLAELALAPGSFSEATRAQVIVDGLPLQALCGDTDDWVGAAAVVLEHAGGARKHRLHIAGSDLLNDWTAVFTTKFGWRR